MEALKTVLLCYDMFNFLHNTEFMYPTTFPYLHIYETAKPMTELK